MKFWTNYVVGPKTNEHIHCPRVKGTEFFYISPANVMFVMPTEGAQNETFRRTRKACHIILKNGKK